MNVKRANIAAAIALRCPVLSLLGIVNADRFRNWPFGDDGIIAYYRQPLL